MLARVVCLGLLVTAALALAAPGPKTAPKSDKAMLEKIRKLQIERREVLKKAVEARRDEFLAGRGTLEALLKLARQLLQADLDVAATAKQRTTAHTAYLELMKEIEKITTTGYEAGRVKAADHYEARAARIEAEIGWLKAVGKVKKGKDKKD